MPAFHKTGLSRCLVPVVLTLALGVAWFGPRSAWAAGDFDPELHLKAGRYRAFLNRRHGYGPGGISNTVDFVDQERTQVECLRELGDSTFFTGLDAGALALEWRVTGDERTYARMVKIVNYLLDVKEVTHTPGYIARYLAPSEPPYTCEDNSGNGLRRDGEGEFAGWFWLGETSRDHYTGWFWGLTLAAEALAERSDAEAEALLTRVREAMTDVIETLEAHEWWILDENGRITGNGAAHVEPFRRLPWLIQAWRVTGDAAIMEIIERRKANIIRHMPADLWGAPNKYFEYFAFNLNHIDFDGLFRCWPDEDEAREIFAIWKDAVRRYTKETHNAWFDALYLANCERLGTCEEGEREPIVEGIRHGLAVFVDAPNFKRYVDPPNLPYDPISVWLSDLVDRVDFLDDLLDVRPQTAEPHIVENRCWEDFLWQRSPYHIGCEFLSDNPLRTSSGLDYLMPYWVGVFNEILPGYDPPTDDDVDDDSDDDDVNDDDVDDDSDDDTVEETDDDDDDDNDGCACG